MTNAELKEFLDHKAKQYENADFLSFDPIQIPHRFKQKEDIEISGILISTIAWGNRKSIIKSGERIIEIMGNSPYEFILNYDGTPEDLEPFVHRTFNTVDLDFFFRGLKHIYLHGGLENAFASQKDHPGAKGRIASFRSKMLEVAHESRSTRHISDPLRGSAAKRLNMFLRWMIRPANNGVDFGIWTSVPTSELCLPLDVHTGTIARKLGLLARKQDDWKALEELMEHLRRFDEKDPVKYDFALFGLGAFEKF